MADDEWSVEDAPATMRQSRGWALAGLLLLLTAAWLPWWTITIESAGFTSRTTQRLWGIGDTGGEARMLWVWASSALVILVAGWSFVRLAGRSWLYEPATWTRDALLHAGLALVAAASAFLWPVRVPFWGSRGYPGAVPPADASFSPGLGWLMALLAAAAYGVAWWRARSTPSPRS